MSALMIQDLTPWAVLAVTFVLVVAGVVVLASMWSQQFGQQSRALRQRVAAFMRNSSGVTIDERLLKATAGYQNSELQALFQKLPGFERLSDLLMRTQSSQSPLGFLGMVLVIWGIGFFVAVLVLNLRLQPALLLASGLALLPLLMHVRKDARQRRKFEELFPEALDYLSRALRSGQGLSSGLGMVGQEFADPIGREFKKTVDEINFGLPFADAMNNMAQRVKSPDLDFFVVAIVIQRETGGNLAELLGGLAKTVRERIRLAGKIRIISAEGRFSGVVLGALPFILAGVLTLLNPKYMDSLWGTPEGLRIVTIGLFMMFLGGIWLWKIVQVRV
ncbi:MAG: type II secretion system F family protein [Limnohabitans sp.]|jgi:tight adherence protein B